MEVPRPEDTNVKWIVKNKSDEFGNITRNKARLVAQIDHLQQVSIIGNRSSHGERQDLLQGHLLASIGKIVGHVDSRPGPLPNRV